MKTNMTLVEHCLRNRELVAEFDRLNGTNLSMVGSPIDLAIDDATGRTRSDLRAFIAFVTEHIAPIVSPPQGGDRHAR